MTRSAAGRGANEVTLKIARNSSSASRIGFVTVAGQQVRVTQEGDKTDREVRVEGRLATLAGSCPAVSFSVGGTAIVTNSGTDFRLACSSLNNGAAVRVRGRAQTDGTVLATRIED